MYIAIAIFVAVYVLMMIFTKARPYIALGGGLVFVITGMLPLAQVPGAIDFNVLLMIAGTMGTVSLVIESKMPNLLADILVEKVPNLKMAILVLSLLAGIVSAFIDNVATVLMIAPIALAMAKKQDVNPVGMIIAIAVSSNLQGAATLVGDTTSILLGGYAGMNFLDFFVYKGKASIFWAVELGALLSAAILLFLFRKENGHIAAGERTKVTDKVPTFLLLGIIVALIGVSFIPNKPELTNGIICMAFMIAGLIYRLAKGGGKEAVLNMARSLDLETLGLLLGLFVMVGGIKAMGVIDAIAGIFARIGNGNIILIYTIIVWMSVLLSAFIDNIPYVATMLPVVAGIAANLNIDPTLLYFGLLTGATLGGNLTPVGASANITGIGILRKAGYEVRNKDFMRIGIPFTLAAVIPAYIYLLLIWY